jgi:hypothetical protein
MNAPSELDLEYAVMPPLPQADWWQNEGQPSALPLQPLPGVGDLPRRLGAQLMSAAAPAPQQQEPTPIYTGAFPCAF